MRGRRVRVRVDTASDAAPLAASIVVARASVTGLAGPAATPRLMASATPTVTAVVGALVTIPVAVLAGESVTTGRGDPGDIERCTMEGGVRRLVQRMGRSGEGAEKIRGTQGRLRR